LLFSAGPQAVQRPLCDDRIQPTGLAALAERRIAQTVAVSERYVPVAGRAVFTPVFDAVNTVTMRQGRWRPTLVDRVRALGSRRVLDVGCGTGAMAIAIARELPAARVIGTDGDPKVLRRARAKAAAVGVELELHEALADHIPLGDGSVDCVVSTLVFHHLPAVVNLPQIVTRAGFSDTVVLQRLRTGGGTLEVIEATR
jgi:2-polyprenyl-3-methyl-5-hydroxy-6-metoxy-1,4-benzoquinol methylase